VRIPTQNFFATPTPVPIYIGNVTATSVVIVTPTTSRPGPGFVKVSVSPTKIYWGGCEANKAVITAQVEDPDVAANVIIFMRVKDSKDEDYTPWTNGNIMINNRDGTFTFTAVGSKIEGHNHYKNSFVYFQLVSVDDRGKEVGRTKIYEKAFSMSPCPCITPVTGCPLPTQKKP
jgi:DNA/RNA endonuclease YhcR with UshA esterase domain